MASGSSVNKLSGRIILGEPNILFNWKGRIAVRALPRKIDQIASRTRKLQHANVAFFATLWRRYLTADQRNRWEEYANLIGSAITADKSQLALGSHNIIPQHKNLKSGFNAYIGSLMLVRWYMFPGLETTGTEAPIGDPNPGPPGEVSVVWEPVPGRVAVSWRNPVWSSPPYNAVVIRVFIEFQSGGRVHKQRCILTLATPPGGIGTLRFATIRGGGTFGDSWLWIRDFSRGLFRVQLDCVSRYLAATRGLTVSAPSSVVEVALP